MGYCIYCNEDIDEKDYKIKGCCGEMDGYADTDWGRKAEARADKREAKLEEGALAILKEYNLFFYRQGDPRGWPFYILTPEIKAKGEGWFSQGIAVCPQ